MKLEALLTISQSYDKSYLVKVLKFARKNYPNAIDFIDDLTSTLERDSIYREKFLKLYSESFRQLNFIAYLVDSGITTFDGLFSMIRKRIGDFILPEIEDNNELSSLLNEIFYEQKNFKWVKLIPKDRWQRLYSVLLSDTSEEQMKEIHANIQSQLLQSISILNDRITGEFADKELIRYTNEVNLSLIHI